MHTTEQPLYDHNEFEATCESTLANFPTIFAYNFHMRLLNFSPFLLSTCNAPAIRTLTDLCKDLTGIQQETVDAAPPFPKVLRSLEEWTFARTWYLGTEKTSFAIVCDNYAIRPSMPVLEQALNSKAFRV